MRELRLRLWMEKRRRVVAVIGDSGYGKSTLAVQLVQHDQRVLIAAPYMKNPYGALTFTTYESLKRTLAAHRPKTFRCALPVYDSEELARLCRLAKVVAPVTLVLDETAYVIQNTSAAPEELRFLALVGRHCGHDDNQAVSLVVLGQVPSNLPTWLRAQSKTVYLFNIEREDDRAKVGADLGLPAETRAFVESRLGSLPVGRRLRLDKGDDAKWTVHEGEGV